MSVLAYASDRYLLGTAFTRSSGLHPAMMASLDHSMWFHAGFRADEWLLFDMRCYRSSGARGLIHGEVYRQDGTLAVSVTQEGLIRYIEDKGETAEKRARL